VKVKRPKFLHIFFIPLITSGMLAAPAAAAPASSSNDTTTPSQSQGADSGSQGSNAVALEFNDGTVLYKPNWTDSGARFTFESKIPTSVTIVDVNSVGDTGSGDVAFKRVRLTPNQKKTVTMDLASEAGSMGVTISNGKELKYASNPQEPLFKKVFRWMLYAGLIIAPIEVVILTSASIWYLKRGLKKGLIQVG
jgi:hypothetical protein